MKSAGIGPEVQLAPSTDRQSEICTDGGFVAEGATAVRQSHTLTEELTSWEQRREIHPWPYSKELH